MQRRRRIPAHVSNLSTRSNLTSGLMHAKSAGDAHSHALRRVTTSRRGTPTGDLENGAVQTRYRWCGSSAHNCPEATLQGLAFRNRRVPLALRQCQTVRHNVALDSLGKQPDRKRIPAGRNQRTGRRRISPARVMSGRRMSPAGRDRTGCRGRSSAGIMSDRRISPAGQDQRNGRRRISPARVMSGGR